MLQTDVRAARRAHPESWGAPVRESILERHQRDGGGGDAGDGFCGAAEEEASWELESAWGWGWELNVPYADEAMTKTKTDRCYSLLRYRNSDNVIHIPSLTRELCNRSTRRCRFITSYYLLNT